MADSIDVSFTCICCGNTQQNKVLTAKDYTVSQQTFSIHACTRCGFRYTADAPDSNAIGKYYAAESYISHTNTNKGFINQLYHLVRSYTLQSKRRLVIQAAKKSKGNLLEVGAGTGFFVEAMLQAGWQVTGLEPDETARQNAKQRAGIVLESPEALWNLPPASFDAITLWHVLEHVHDLKGYLQQFHQLLKPTGILIIAVPNYTSGDAGYYGEYWAAYDVPRHLYHFSPESMEALLQNHQFQPPRLVPMWFDAFYVSMLSEKYKTTHNRPVMGALQGLLSNGKAIFNKRKTSSLIYISNKQV